jgi:heptosyltransferase-3
MAGLIKKNYPSCKIFFLGRTYTKDLIALSEFVDEFINYDEIEKLGTKSQIQFIKKFNADVFLHVFPKKKIATLAKNAKIPDRVGTTNRIYHWFTCNKLIKLSRKNSLLHEAQLNIKLLSFLNIETDLTLDKIHTYYGFTKIPILEEKYNALIDKAKFNLVLHPKSKGSAKEWPLSNFRQLIRLLPKDKFKIFISGTEHDATSMQEFLNESTGAVNITGKLSLQQFIAFINACDGLIAASTGPLHIAAALNKKAIGLFSPKRPIHPGRWMPLGKDAHVVVFDKDCDKCLKKQDCDCITRIKPEQIVSLLNT